MDGYPFKHVFSQCLFSDCGNCNVRLMVFIPSVTFSLGFQIFFLFYLCFSAFQTWYRILLSVFGLKATLSFSFSISNNYDSVFDYYFDLTITYHKNNLLFFVSFSFCFHFAFVSFWLFLLGDRFRSLDYIGKLLLLVAKKP